MTPRWSSVMQAPRSLLEQRVCTKWRSLSSRRNWVGNPSDPVEDSPEKLRAVAQNIKDEAKRLGLALVGITSPRRSSRFEQYKEWLQNNYHGELDYMEREDRVARRADPSLILPEVRSVIMVGLVYWPGRTGFPPMHDYGGNGMDKATQADGPARGLVSAYAWGADYHTLLGKRVRTLARKLNAEAGGVGRFYVDTGAVLERDFAERAGLGFVGKNGLVIDRVVGSGFFIGEIFSTVALPFDGDEDIGTVAQKRGRPGCGGCTKCKTACPTDAIVEDRVIDARRCISYLTIELKGSIPETLREGMGNRVYGCDICQTVCPWNRLAWEGMKRGEGQGGFSPLFGTVGEQVATPVLTELLQVDEAGFRERFKGSAIRRIGRERMARNAAVALGNVGGRQELAAVRYARDKDESALVREHAAWAVGRIARRVGEDEDK